MSTQVQTSPLVHLALFGCGAFAFFGVYTVHAILPTLMQEMHASVLMGSYFVSATILAIAIFSPIMGVISDRIGRKRLILFGIFALAVPTFLLGLAVNAHQVIALRFIQGVLVPALSVVAVAYVGDECKHPAQAMPFYVAGSVLGGFMGRFLMGYLALWDWRGGFMVLAGLMCLGGICIARALPHEVHFTRQNNNPLPQMCAHLKHPALLGAMGVGAALFFVLVGGFTLINVRLAQAPWHLGSHALGQVFFVYLVGMLVTPYTSRLLTRFGLQQALLGCLGMSLIGVVLSIFGQFWVIIVALTLICTGIFIGQSLVTSYLASAITTARSLASGLYYMVYYLGGALGAIGCAAAWAYGGWPMVAMLMALALGGAMWRACRLP